MVVETAEPLDPASVLLTLHKSGLFTWKGEAQTKEQIVKRAGSSETVNRTPILLEVESDAPFSVVRDALYVLTGDLHCVNYSFLVETKNGPGAVVLPMLADRGMGYQFYEGRKEIRKVGGDGNEKHVEVVVSAGKNGEIIVKDINYLIPNTVVPTLEYIDPPPNRRAWTGAHLPFGMWTREMLRTFLTRPDVAALGPYVLFKVTNYEPAADVVCCLSALRTIGDVAVVPSIPTK